MGLIINEEEISIQVNIDRIEKRILKENRNMIFVRAINTKDKNK